MPITSHIASPIASRTRSKRMKIDVAPDKSLTPDEKYIKVLRNAVDVAEYTLGINKKAEAIFSVFDTILQVEKDDPVKNNCLFKNCKLFITFYTKFFELENQLLAIKLNSIAYGTDCEVDFYGHAETIQKLKQNFKEIGKKRGFMSEHI